MHVSICIPVYNMESCIERCIKSALKQDYADFEVIVIDNCSSDNTYKIAKSIIDSKLKIYRNKSNLGAYGNHNRCLELAKGEWVKFLHGDDELLSNCISSMVMSLEKCPHNTAIIACGAINYGSVNKEIERTFIPDSLFVMRPAHVSEFILEGNFFGTPSMSFIHRESLISLGGFDISMEPASDGDCWINLRRSFASAFMPEHLVVIRDDPPGNRGQKIKQAIRFCDQLFRQIDKWHKLDKEVSDIDLKDTIYSDWAYREVFRYWYSSLRHVLVGRFDLLFLLLKRLISRKIALKSIQYYLSKRLIGRDMSDFRGQPWTVSLSKLRL